MGKEPKADDIPPEYSDFPDFVQDLFRIYNLMPNRIESNIGYIGKDYSSLGLLFDTFDIHDSKSKVMAWDILSYIDDRVIRISSEKMKKEMEKMKRKAKHGQRNSIKT